MPYRKHTPFDQPNWEQDIWRYISVTQLLSILQNEALWFTRSDQFDDPFEGMLPQGNGGVNPDSEVILPDHAIVRDYGNGDLGSYWETKNLRSKLEANRRIAFVNCWHQKGHESDTMWRAHLDGSVGVVIKTTAGQLRDAFTAYESNDVYIGRINYVDYDTAAIPQDNDLYPIVHKREAFEQEREIRAVVTELPNEYHPGYKGRVNGDHLNLNWEDQKTGQHIDVDVKGLIDCIRIAPTAPDWVKVTIQKQIRQLGYDIPVEQSTLALDPY